jgi:hypothetical protein
LAEYIAEGSFHVQLVIFDRPAGRHVRRRAIFRDHFIDELLDRQYRPYPRRAGRFPGSMLALTSGSRRIFASNTRTRSRRLSRPAG